MLKLTAKDTEDLKVISAHMQDALVRLADIRYLAKPRQFALLAISFEPGQAPSGTVVLTFSADCTIKLVVEYLDLQMKDLGGAWATELTPHHGD